MLGEPPETELISSSTPQVGFESTPSDITLATLKQKMPVVLLTNLITITQPMQRSNESTSLTLSLNDINAAPVVDIKKELNVEAFVTKLRYEPSDVKMISFEGKISSNRGAMPIFGIQVPISQDISTLLLFTRRVIENTLEFGDEIVLFDLILQGKNRLYSIHQNVPDVKLVIKPWYKPSAAKHEQSTVYIGSPGQSNKVLLPEPDEEIYKDIELVTLFEEVAHHLQLPVIKGHLSGTDRLQLYWWKENFAKIEAFDTYQRLLREGINIAPTLSPYQVASRLNLTLFCHSEKQLPDELNDDANKLALTIIGDETLPLDFIQRNIDYIQAVHEFIRHQEE